MCVSPSVLANGVTVGCRRCWQCLDNRVSDWCGRNIAETMTAVESYAVRLSYGRDHDGLADHLHSVMLFSSDMQKLLKRMRSKRFGYKVRYMIAGEYGSTFGRAHWHGIFHFYGNRLPDWKKYTQIADDQWERIGGVNIPEWSFADGTPIGHVHIKPAQYAHVRYALKYMLKDQDDPFNAIKVLMAKYPPLGTQYLTEYAREIARAGLAPQDLTYRFPVVKYDGEQEVKRFMMRGKVSELFVQAYLAEWEMIHGGRTPESELVDGYLRFGRIGRSEYLTPIEVEEKEREAKWAKREAEYRPPTLAAYWQRRAAEVRLKKSTFGLSEWEERYFGAERRQGTEVRQSGYNDQLLLQYVLWRNALTEREFWAIPFDQLERLWSAAERDFNGARYAEWRFPDDLPWNRSKPRE